MEIQAIRKHARRPRKRQGMPKATSPHAGAKATRKTRGTRRNLPAAISRHDDEIIAAIKAEPFFAAAEACTRARALFVLNRREDDKTMDRLGSALFDAEMKTAETVPTTLRGIAASARWMCRLIAEHDGVRNMDGHSALEAWPHTIREAFRRMDDAEDPAIRAVSTFKTEQRFLDRTKAPEGSREYREAERNYVAAQRAMQSTPPRHLLGVVWALETIAEQQNGTMDQGYRDWLVSVARAVRAMA